jgi:hypothetical protein
MRLRRKVASGVIYISELLCRKYFLILQVAEYYFSAVSFPKNMLVQSLCVESLRTIVPNAVKSAYIKTVLCSQSYHLVTRMCRSLCFKYRHIIGLHGSKF